MNYMGGTFVRQAFQRKIADSNTARLYMEAQGAVFRPRIKMYKANAKCT